MAELPPPPRAGRYVAILADPPWEFVTRSDKGKGRSAERHYSCMTLDAIKGLPVGSWAAKSAALYLWATVPCLERALAVAAAWGFSYRSGFVWVKERIGTGYWARNRHEHLLICGRGDGICPRYCGIAPVDSVVEGQQRNHSRKPDRVYQIIEAYHPDVARLELFARRRWPGWDAWGDQLDPAELAPPTECC